VVEAHAVAVQRVADPRHEDLDPLRGELVGRQPGGAGDPLGHLGDVLALVAVLRRLLAAGAGEDRLAEPADLAPAVVEVVLALDRVARELQDARERVAERRVAARGGRERAGRVGRDELHLHALAAVARPEALARVEHAAHGREVPGVGEEQVQEARAGDLDPVDAVAQRLLERGAELLRDRARRLAQERGEQHRRVRRVVAEARLLRALQGEAVGRAVGAQFAGGGLHRGAEVVERRAGHGAR
jgi:hypothetical protein